MSTALQRLKEQVLQAHNALHDDDVKTAHVILHKILGVDDETYIDPKKPLLSQMKFDHHFRRLCKKSNRQAAYILAEATETPGKIRLIAGGDAEICNVLKIGDK